MINNFRVSCGHGPMVHLSIQEPLLVGKWSFDHLKLMDNRIYWKVTKINLDSLLQTKDGFIIYVYIYTPS